MAYLLMRRAVSSSATTRGAARLVRGSVTERRGSKGVRLSKTRTFAAMEPKDFGGKEPSQVDEAEWKKILSPEEYRILRQKGTEYPGTGEYNKFYPKDGTFHCAGCNIPLYESKAKFDSGCGWPAFYEGIGSNVKEVPDADGYRIEIVCANCGGHLGHVFKGEGFKTPTNARHCVNSVSVKYSNPK